MDRTAFVRPIGVEPLINIRVDLTQRQDGGVGYRYEGCREYLAGTGPDFHRTSEGMLLCCEASSGNMASGSLP
jgi:hypothetical protein